MINFGLYWCAHYFHFQNGRREQLHLCVGATVDYISDARRQHRAEMAGKHPSLSLGHRGIKRSSFISILKFAVPDNFSVAAFHDLRNRTESACVRTVDSYALDRADFIKADLFFDQLRLPPKKARVTDMKDALTEKGSPHGPRNGDRSDLNERPGSLWSCPAGSSFRRLVQSDLQKTVS